MKLLLFLCLFSSSVQSCRTVSRSGVTLTGVCPNETFTVPIGAKRTYHCSFNVGNSSMVFLYYWNISGNIGTSGSNPIPPVVGITTTTTDSTVTIVADANEVLDIQFSLLCTLNCFSSPGKFIETESISLITFGKY